MSVSSDRPEGSVRSSHTGQAPKTVVSPQQAAGTLPAPTAPGKPGPTKQVVAFTKSMNPFEKIVFKDKTEFTFGGERFVTADTALIEKILAVKDKYGIILADGKDAKHPAVKDAIPDADPHTVVHDSQNLNLVTDPHYKTNPLHPTDTLHVATYSASNPPSVVPNSSTHAADDTYVVIKDGVTKVVPKDALVPPFPPAAVVPNRPVKK